MKKTPFGDKLVAAAGEALAHARGHRKLRLVSVRRRTTTPDREMKRELAAIKNGFKDLRIERQRMLAVLVRIERKLNGVLQKMVMKKDIATFGHWMDSKFDAFERLASRRA